MKIEGGVTDYLRLKKLLLEIAIGSQVPFPLVGGHLW